jgi:hypothetical protein
MPGSIFKGAFVFLVVVFIGSCKKETDEYGPKVVFNTPFENQSFMVYDNIAVNASVSDETRITELAITLVDLNYIPVQSSLLVPVSSSTITVNVSYPVDNIHLESGMYYLMITASDGKNDSRTFRRVLIIGVPKVLKKVFVATSSSVFQTNLSFIDSTFSGMNFNNTFSGDYLAVSSSSYDQQVFMCGNYTGAFTSLTVPDNTLKFTISPAVSASPYFTGFYAEDRKIFVGRYDETIKGYSTAGNIIYSGTANPGYYVRRMIMNNGYMVAEEKHKTSSGKVLVSFYSTGTPEQQVAINQDVVAFCEKDDHKVFVFGNNAGQGVIQLYDRLNNNLWDPYPYSLAAGSILSAVKIDLDTYLIGHSNGTIYKYQYTSGSMTTYLNGYAANQLKYDALNNNVYIVEANLITAVDYPSKVIMHSVSSAESILGISFLYNR